VDIGGRLKILGPLYELARTRDNLVHSRLGVISSASEELELSRFVFDGPRGGGDAVRFGLFAGIHGDEPAGVIALCRLLEQLARQPEIAEGYRLLVYPACNPSGIIAGTRHSRNGKDLNREFWMNSAEAEVRLLESEIRSQRFHGLISLHADDTSHGMYGFVRGAVLAKGLLEPALKAAEAVLPRNTNAVIDGFAAENGIISKCYDGILTSPPELEPAPFEITLETPHAAAEEQQVEALVRALTAILSEYQELLSYAANL
jgi:protein MpaA